MDQAGRHTSHRSVHQVLPRTDLSIRSIQAVQVGVLVYLMDVEPYDGQNMDFRMDYFLRQIWTAPEEHCKHFFTDVDISERRKKIRSE